VWEDADGNGRQNPGEPGLPGVTVELLGAHESLVATTTTTNGRGRWWFIVDTAGAYWVRVTAPDGRAFTTRDVGGDNRDSDADDTGLITIGALSPGGIDISLDAGLLLAPGTIEIVKDASPDGPQDFTFTDDIAAPNVFTLDDDGADATHSNTKTFQAVAPGLYRVNEAAVDGWVVTSVTCLDSDGLGMPSTGDTLKRSAVIELDPGETVTCTFTNTANQAPLFDGNEGGVTLLIDAAENQTAVTDLEATDADGDTENGGGLTYSLTVGGEGDDNDLFTLDVDTGVLTFTTAPDFENPTDDLADNLYLAQVQVTDSGGLFDIQDITVTVTDVGEALEITSDGGGATAAVSAAENQTAVTDVQAFDPEGDTENGGGLTYALTGGAAECDLLRCDLRIVPTVGADNGRFTLDPATGVLTFTAAPDFENPLDLDGDNDYQVQVTVTDSDLNTDVQDITVTVTDVDDAPLNGTITVTLTASVPGPDVITFSEDITAEAAFMLDDNPASGMPNTITFENVTPGTYSVSRAPFSLMLLGNGCTDTDAGGVASVMDLATGVATINLEAGETVACTFLGIFE
ncbi:MAG: cadherin domain-containing protein, partial [Actinobacteria bacterium]|nr:cadherin domain-containing protein [Actinomycetota bacterium]